MQTKTGILIVNLGTPDTPERKSVYKYLLQFLLDKRVIDISWLGRQLLVRGIIAPFRSGNSAKLYQKLWTEKGSPLKHYGYEVTQQLQQNLGQDYVVELAMRYQSPSISDAVSKLMKQNISKIVVFPMFPQYASATTGSVHEEVMEVIKKQQIIPDVRFINSYYDDPDMIAVYCKNAKKYTLSEYDHFLFSYHGLPQRQLVKADHNNHCLKSDKCCQTLCEKNQFCYSAQCYATTSAIAKQLQLSPEQYTVCFQSRLGKDPWIQPYTSEVLDNLVKKGKKKILVFCPAFTADCLETIIEITHEYREEFLEKGGEQLDLVESLNADPDWVKCVEKLVR